MPSEIAAATPYPSAMEYFSEEFETSTHTSADEQFDPHRLVRIRGSGGSMTITNEPGAELDARPDPRQRHRRRGSRYLCRPEPSLSALQKCSVSKFPAFATTHCSIRLPPVGRA